MTQGKCTQLPGAGVATTGEFTTVRNGTDASIEHKISKTVEESNSTSVSLDESVELSNKTTVEAGTDFGAGSGSVSNEFSATFGIDKSSTQDHSKTTSVTVEDTINVSPGKTVAITFTTDDAAVDCDVDINAEGDWSSIKVEAQAPFDWQNRGKPVVVLVGRGQVRADQLLQHPDPAARDGAGRLRPPDGDDRVQPGRPGLPAAEGVRRALPALRRPAAHVARRRG